MCGCCACAFEVCVCVWDGGVGRGLQNYCKLVYCDLEINYTKNLCRQVYGWLYKKCVEEGGGERDTADQGCVAYLQKVFEAQ